MEKLLDYDNLYLKFEAGNPSGTMKDRAAFVCLKEAKRLNYKELVIGSCGNFGAAFVRLAPLFGVKPHVYIPDHYHTPRIIEMERQGGIIHRAKGTYEEVVALSSEEAKRKGWFDANPGTEPGKTLSIEAYATLSFEIFEKLGCAPDAVATPVGNGTTLAGLHHGFKMLKKEGKISKLPAMIAVGTPGGNPVVKCVLEKRKKIIQLRPEEVVETELNEPMVSWICLDGQEALDAVWESNGYATYVKDSEMLSMSNNLLKEEGLSVLPASAASLVAIQNYVKEKRIKKGLNLVALLTARIPY